MNGIRTTPLINGVVPNWAQLTININGVLVKGVTAIEYNDDQQVDPVYGIGQTAVGVGYGNITCTGSITLLRTEIEALRAASKTGRLQDVAPFVIIVSYIPTAGGKKIITHKLIDCIIKDDKHAATQGDTKNEQQLNLFIGEIKWR
jgi:hypothetical protein